MPICVSCGEAAPPKPVVFQVSLYPYPVPAKSYKLQLTVYVRFVEVSDYRVANETRTVLRMSAAALHAAAQVVTRIATDGEEVLGMDRGTVGSANRGRLQVEARTEGRSEVVTPVGELDHHTADLLREPLESAVEQGRSRLVVDCSRLDFCDSTGLNVLLGARLKAEEVGGGVHLAGMLPVVARVFEITGAEAVFTVHATLEEALRT